MLGDIEPGWIWAIAGVLLLIAEIVAPGFFLVFVGAAAIATGLFIAAVFLVVGCFLDAIPAIIIVGTILQPIAAAGHLDPVHFAMIGIVSLAFGLVTPPYGLCLMICCKVADMRLVDALRAVAQERGATVAQVAIAWVASRGEDIVPLVGARTRNRLRESLDARALVLSGADLAAIEAAVPAEAVAGTRYDAVQMSLLDSEK